MTTGTFVTDKADTSQVGMIAAAADHIAWIWNI